MGQHKELVEARQRPPARPIRADEWQQGHPLPSSGTRQTGYEQHVQAVFADEPDGCASALDVRGQGGEGAPERAPREPVIVLERSFLSITDDHPVQALIGRH